MSDTRLVGRWELLSLAGRADDGVLTHPLGPDAQGCLVYTSRGWMAVQISAAGRPRLLTEDLHGGTDAERAAAYSTYDAYSGTYEVRDDVVVHHVTMSLFPNRVGTEQSRHFELTGDELVLRTGPTTVGGKALVNELRWRREEH